MRILPILFATMLLTAGCSWFHEPPKPTQPEMFSANAMRIHPVFTRLQDWTGDGKPDGIEALLEFTDSFGDPTKASGQALFELYEYRPNNPDPRGARLVNPWIGSIRTAGEQHGHWNNTTQTYNFQLAWADINPSATYVLTATFESAGGKRFFDRTILTPSQESNGVPSTSTPDASPAHP